MNKLLNNLTYKEIWLEIFPSFAVSLIIAEVFYKFGSFSLECLAFLGTWYTFGLVAGWFRKK